jgi:hypothetical protein
LQAESTALSEALGPFKWVHPTGGQFGLQKHDSKIETHHQSRSRPIEMLFAELSTEQLRAIELFLVRVNQHFVSNRKWRLVRLKKTEQPTVIAGLHRRGKGSRVDILLQRASELQLTSLQPSAIMAVRLPVVDEPLSHEA